VALAQLLIPQFYPKQAHHFCQLLIMKVISTALIATAGLISCSKATASTQLAQHQEIDVSFVDSDVYHSDEAATDNQGERKLQVVESIVAAFEIASAITPLITDAIESTKKECQQVACWIATNSRTCAISAAEETQTDIMKGRDRYAYEDLESNGMWVRYWRTTFEPIDRGDIASGNCTDGSTFTVTNCQSTGSVYC
jgi:hypothetical protein